MSSIVRSVDVDISFMAVLATPAQYVVQKCRLASGFVEARGGLDGPAVNYTSQAPQALMGKVGASWRYRVLLAATTLLMAGVARIGTAGPVFRSLRRSIHHGADCRGQCKWFSAASL